MTLDEKDPDDIKDYGIDWTPHLDPGDTIDTSAWAIIEPTGDPNDMGIDALGSNIDGAGLITKVFVNKGRDGIWYSLRNRIVTVAGRNFDKTLRIRVKEQ